MSNITLNSIPNSVFYVAAEEVSDKQQQRADIVGAGRVLMYEHAAHGVTAIKEALNKKEFSTNSVINKMQYKALNERFQKDHMLYAAAKVCEYTGEEAPEDFNEFRKNAAKFYGSAHFFAILQGIYQEVITPILPAVYSEAVSVFADVMEVGFGETAAITITSNDIPIFQDSSWGASRSVPRNRLYAQTYTLNPQPKTAQITAKWMQLIGNGMDFGAFFANIAAGMYAKTMGMWNEVLTTATSNTNLIPSGLNYTFNSTNWVTGANKIAALNSTTISNLFATGNMVALAKVLPTQITGTTNVNMDAAIATLLGADYTKSGYLGEFMAVRLLPLMDAIVPGTQNTDVDTVLSSTDIWMLASSGRKPLTIAFNSGTPITIEMDPTKTADFEIGINMTTSIDSVATFASKVAHFTI